MHGCWILRFVRPFSFPNVLNRVKGYRFCESPIVCEGLEHARIWMQHSYAIVIIGKWCCLHIYIYIQYIIYPNDGMISNASAMLKVLQIHQAHHVSRSRSTQHSMLFLVGLGDWLGSWVRMSHLSLRLMFASCISLPALMASWAPFSETSTSTQPVHFRRAICQAPTVLQALQVSSAPTLHTLHSFVAAACKTVFEVPLRPQMASPALTIY